MIYLNQSKYIGTIFKQFGMAKNKPIQISFMTNYKLSKDLGSQNGTDLKVIWVIPFQNVIGSFMYAMVCKKFDIGHVVGFVS
jgi:hypothetical protein